MLSYFFQTGVEDIGELYQDEDNQAAILMRNEGGDVVLVSGYGQMTLAQRGLSPSSLKAKQNICRR